MKLEWSPALSVGIAEIDAQHQELFRRAARLLDGLHRGEPAEMGELVDYLHRYAVTHFGEEESSMRDARYPGYARHKAEHDRFIGDLLVIAADLERDGSGKSLARRVDHWLREWLREHVSGTDAELARFLARRNA